MPEINNYSQNWKAFFIGCNFEDLLVKTTGRIGPINYNRTKLESAKLTPHERKLIYIQI